MMIIGILLVIGLPFGSCSIEGEKICGIWNSDNGNEQMKLEITPWKGKFFGYLLEYKNEKETIKGAKEEAFIFLTNLVYENGIYKNGTILADQQGKEGCDIELNFVDDNHLKAIYNCSGQKMEEIWTREGHEPLPDTSSLVSKNGKTGANKSGAALKTQKEQVGKTSKAKTERKNDVSTASQTTSSLKEKEVPDYEEKTKSQAAFHVIGYHKTVAYDDTDAIAKAMESLWTKSYEQDFSGKLENITDTEKMYVIYSNYDQPKGKMTITIGYKVKGLRDVPSGLKGVSIPANDYLVYPLSGKASDYEDEGWEQLGELMAYRKPETADFETYTFDANYEVKNIEMWIATK